MGIAIIEKKGLSLFLFEKKDSFIVTLEHDV